MRILVAKTILWAKGWKINGLPPDVPKFLLIAAPHTSNWDFVFGICTLFILKMKMSWFAKDSLFKGPQNRMLKNWGGIPVDRKNKSNTVSLIIEQFALRDSVSFGLAPEGTRRFAETWKSGFYHMALAAGVPLALAFFDYRQKEVGVGLTMYLTGEINADMEKIRRFYATKQARYPDKVGPVRLREETPMVG